MRIVTARAQMVSAREKLTKREEDIAKMRLENPAIRLHGGPRERYNIACKCFVVAQLEHLMLKRQRNVVELMAARDELSFRRLQFFKNQEVIALENRRNHVNYEAAQRRFTSVHKRLRTLRMAPINQEPTTKEEFPINQEPTTREEFTINQEPTTKEELAQRRFIYLHKRLHSLRMAQIIEEFPISQVTTIKEEFPIKKQ